MNSTPNHQRTKSPAFAVTAVMGDHFDAEFLDLLGGVPDHDLATARVRADEFGRPNGTLFVQESIATSAGPIGSFLTLPV